MFRSGLMIFGVVFGLMLMGGASPLIDLYYQHQKTEAAELLADKNLGWPQDYDALAAGHYKVINRLDGNTMLFAELVPHGDIYRLVDNVPNNLDTSGAPFYKAPTT